MVNRSHTAWLPQSNVTTGSAVCVYACLYQESVGACANVHAPVQTLRLPARTYSIWCIDASMQHPEILRAVTFVATRAEDSIITAVQVKQLFARLRRSSGSSARPYTCECHVILLEDLLSFRYWLVSAESWSQTPAGVPCDHHAHCASSLSYSFAYTGDSLRL